MVNLFQVNMVKRLPGVTGKSYCHLVSCVATWVPCWLFKIHRGCVTPDILRSLAVTDQSTIIGLGNIR